jgi:hypothetical protein
MEVYSSDTPALRYGPQVPWTTLTFWFLIVGGLVAAGLGLIRKSASLLVAGGVILWSVAASMLSFPILLHVLVAGGAIGFVAARHASWKLLVYVPIGIAGALVGALLSFGDAPFLVRHPFLNPWTLSVTAAVLFVTVLAAVDVSRHRRQP